MELHFLHLERLDKNKSLKPPGEKIRFNVYLYEQFVPVDSMKRRDISKNKRKSTNLLFFEMLSHKGF